MRDMIRGEFVDIIEWLDDTNTTLAWRFPRYRNEIKNGAQLVVREGQRAMFVYRGQLADQFNPGHYTLTSENMPIMGTLQGWKYGFNSPFRSEVYYVNTRPYPDLRWGTPQPVTVRDPDFKMVQVRANGTTVVRVTDPTVFLRQVLGTQSVVDMDQITEMIRRNIALAFNDMVMGSGLGAIDLQGRQVELSDKLREFVAQRVQAFGLGIDAVTMTISLPEEIQQAMTRGVARGLEESGFLNNVGDLDRFAQARQSRRDVGGGAKRGRGRRWLCHPGGPRCGAGQSDGQCSAGRLRPTATFRGATLADARCATAVAPAATVSFRSGRHTRWSVPRQRDCGSSSPVVS